MLRLGSSGMWRRAGKVRSYQYSGQHMRQESKILYFSLAEEEVELLNNQRDGIEKCVELYDLLGLWKHYEFEFRYLFKTYQICTLCTSHSASKKKGKAIPLQAWKALKVPRGSDSKISR